MSKSVLILLIIGIAGAVLMSLMMQHLAEFKADRDRSPYCAAVESRLGAKRVGPVRIDEDIDGQGLCLTVHARVMTGFNNHRIANSAGTEVWLGALRAGVRLDRVSVILIAGKGEQAEAFEIPPPPRWSAKKIVGAKHGSAAKSSGPALPKSDLGSTSTSKVGPGPIKGH